MEMEELSLADEEFQELWSDRRTRWRGIIALKGLPFTGKVQVANILTDWLHCPAIFIDDFLSFTTLCNVAKRHLSMFYRNYGSTVVIKSSLNSTLELEQLVQLTNSITYMPTFPLLIIECQIRNEYKWKQRFEYFAGNYDEPSSRSWRDIEKAKEEDDAQSPTWDADHLQLLLKGIDYDPSAVVKLVVDPVNDLSFDPFSSKGLGVPYSFIYVVKYLLDQANSQVLNQDNIPYVVEFDTLRQSLFDKELSAATPRSRSKYLCSSGCCVFKYWQALEDCDWENRSPREVDDCCQICQEKVSGPAYTCYFCILTLHKSCAERIHFLALEFVTCPEGFGRYGYPYPKEHACRSCIEKGEGLGPSCKACVIQTHLKYGLTPFIINHNFHQHFLSMQIGRWQYNCKACGLGINYASYGCKKCAFYYHPHCALLPLEAMRPVEMHEEIQHGRHEHVMKLVYSHDATEPEDDY